MIWTVFQVNLRRLLHNRVELLLTFVVPIAFFSIFALIFGGGIGIATPKIKVIAIDEANSEQSEEMIASLKQNPGLRFMRDPSESLTSDHARELVRRGGVAMAIIVREEDRSVKVDLLADASDQVAGQVASALVSRSLMEVNARAAATRMMEGDMATGQTARAPFDKTNSIADSIDNELTDNRFAGPATFAISQFSARTELDLAESPVNVTAPKIEQPEDAVRVVDVMGLGKANPVVSMYAAGIAVMFMLFGATGGGGALLDERESQTLDRLLSTRLTMDQLILGKWFYLTAIGTLQVCVMFLWGQIVFGVDLLGHLDGFVIMTVVTASAAAAFGLFLATLCRTRGQLNGLSVVLVLTMSALGGSMVPRYIMSQRLQDWGWFTFNAWALDGYDKIFWRELPVASLSPQLTVLMGSGVLMLMAARMLATRWETE